MSNLSWNFICLTGGTEPHRREQYEGPAKAFSSAVQNGWWSRSSNYRRETINTKIAHIFFRGKQGGLHRWFRWRECQTDHSKPIHQRSPLAQMVKSLTFTSNEIRILPDWFDGKN
jgi:hypothetical protein